MIQHRTKDNMIKPMTDEKPWGGMRADGTRIMGIHSVSASTSVHTSRSVGTLWTLFEASCLRYDVMSACAGWSGNPVEWRHDVWPSFQGIMADLIQTCCHKPLWRFQATDHTHNGSSPLCPAFSLSEKQITLMLVAGKGTRARLAMASAQVTKSIWADSSKSATFALAQIAWAVAVELTHAASLVHDDILDHSSTRREQTCLHHTHGVPHAILWGDGLMSLAMGLIVHIPCSKTACMLAQQLQSAIHHMVVGQLAEQALQRARDLKIARHKRMIASKTGALMAASAWGGTLGVRDPATKRCAWLWGLAYGMAYQLWDDISEFQEPWCWTPYHDACQGKVTLPLLMACHTDNRWHRAVCDLSALQNLAQNPDASQCLRQSVAWARTQAAAYTHWAHRHVQNTALDLLHIQWLMPSQ